MQVEAYRRPEIELEAAFSKRITSGGDVEAVVNARYYFWRGCRGDAGSMALNGREEYFSVGGGYTAGKHSALWLTP